MDNGYTIELEDAVIRLNKRIALLQEIIRDLEDKVRLLSRTVRFGGTTVHYI